MMDVLERALATMMATLAADPNQGSVRLSAAEILFELGRLSEATEQATAALLNLANGPDRARALALLAKLRGEDAPANVLAMPGLRLLGDGTATPDIPVAESANSISFSSVGGLDAVKDTIRMRIVLPFQKPEIFRAYGKQAGGGVLLYGPPGCGKTMLARATAGEIGARFLSVAINDVLDMWMGESEKHLAALFDDARRRAPAVLFFDEAEAIAANRQKIQGAGRSLVNQLLAEMDGVKPQNQGLLVMAATNAPWHVDSAMLRPGRFDRIVFVPPPDVAARAEIFRLHLRNRPVEGDLLLDQRVEETEGWSGADIAGVVERAVEAPLREALRTGIQRPIRAADLAAAVGESRATTEEWFETAKNYVTFANSGGLYDDLGAYLSLRKKPKRKSWFSWGQPT